MVAIDEKSAGVMRRLVGRLEDGYLKLDRAAGTFMPLVVERIGAVFRFHRRQIPAGKFVMAH